MRPAPPVAEPPAGYPRSHRRLPDLFYRHLPAMLALCPVTTYLSVGLDNLLLEKPPQCRMRESVKLKAVSRALLAIVSAAAIAGTALTGCGSDENNLESAEAAGGAPDCTGKNRL